jgi:hypothetical protein
LPTRRRGSRARASSKQAACGWTKLPDAGEPAGFAPRGGRRPVRPRAVLELPRAVDQAEHGASGSIPGPPPRSEQRLGGRVSAASRRGRALLRRPRLFREHTPPPALCTRVDAPGGVPRHAAPSRRRTAARPAELRRCAPNPAARGIKEGARARTRSGARGTFGAVATRGQPSSQASGDVRRRRHAGAASSAHARRATATSAPRDAGRRGCGRGARLARRPRGV